MSEPYPKLAHPPIVEAIVDFDCDVPPNRNLNSLEQPARQAFQAQYPEVQPRYLQEARVAATQDGAFNSSLQRSLQAWMFRTPDGKRLVQVRQSGFSINHLAPYGGFDQCLPAIEAAWSQYRDLVAPIVLREVRLRYINRILLPADEIERDGLDHFLAVDGAPPTETHLKRSSFLTQYQAVDPATGLRATVVLASQPPEGEQQPIVFDNGVAASGEWDPSGWEQIVHVLASLQELKNRVFFQTIKPTCLERFQ